MHSKAKIAVGFEVPRIRFRRMAAPAVVAVLAAITVVSPGTALAAPVGKHGERTFFLTLDAVPYSAVAALHSAGGAPELFNELGPPVPLISTFPSTTTVALGEALAPLGLEISPGYEARFFDWEREAVRGGGVISYFRIEFPWRDFFEWNKKGVARRTLASMRPVRASEHRVIGAFNKFLASSGRDFFAYIGITDIAAHLRGPSSLDEMFRDLGLAIRAARTAGEKFRVVVFSDHGIAGGEPLKNVLPGILEQLERAGLRRVKRLSGSGEVVLTPYGLVSSLEAYAHDETVPRLVEALVSVEGVGLCAYRADGALWVMSDRGLAIIANRSRRANRSQRADRSNLSQRADFSQRSNLSQEWAYLAQAGDPLRYRNVVARMREAAQPDREWFEDSKWFEATKREFYPDALHRIARGFELVENPATVICSADPGYMYGAKKTERAARLTGGRLRWTHGALHWEASAGFLLTDVSRPSEGGIRLGSALLPLVSGPRVSP